MQNYQDFQGTSAPLSGYLILVFIIMASSSIVLIEPAPVDIGVIFLLGVGILFHTIKLPYSNILTGSIFLYILIIANLMSMFELEDSTAGLKYFAITFYLVLSWFLIIGLIGQYGDRAVRILFNGYTIAALFAASIGILSYFGVIPWQDTLMKVGRVQGLFKDPNVFGPFLIPIALYAYSKLENTWKNNKIWWLLILLTMALGIFLSYSRAAWGNFLITFLVYIILRFFIKPSFKFLISFFLILVILSAALMYVLSIPSINAMFNERFEYQGYDDDRFSNQAVALSLGFENPFGIGPGQYEGSIGYATHSSYLRIWAENGFIGFIGFIGFVLATLYRNLRLIFITKKPLFIIIFALALGLLFNSIVVDTIHWRHFWIIFAIPWAYKYDASSLAMANDFIKEAKPLDHP